MIKSLQKILRLEIIGNHESTHGIVDAWITSLLIAMAELIETHLKEVVSLGRLE